MKIFSSKKKFPQSPKSTKKYSSKYNGNRSVINIAQNFGHILRILIYNTRLIYFTDQYCVILRSWKITKRNRQWLDLHFLWMSIPKTLKWNIAHAQIYIQSWHVKFTGQRKASEKWARVKVHLLINATIKQPPISALSKNLRWPEMNCRICRLGLYNLKTRQKLKM